jgi:hypothetical protein
MTVTAWFIAFALAAAQAPAPPRFDVEVRADFSRDSAATEMRLQNGMDACERARADNPKHAEALVWHGSGLAFQAGQAFLKGDMTSTAS